MSARSVLKTPACPLKAKIDARAVQRTAFVRWIHMHNLIYDIKQFLIREACPSNLKGS
ncbi:hypothetical protein Plhal304r1_c018g0065231 [Plasmopara halstedii]